MAERMTKRELQSPDKFQKEAGGWLDWAHEHPREVGLAGAGLLAVILVIGLVFGGDSRGGWADSEAGAALSQALELTQRPVVEPGDAAAEGQDETFPSEQAKQEAIAKALTDVRTRHAGSSTALAAALPLADANFKLGKLDEALALYDEYLKKAPKDAEMRFLALEGRAVTLESKGDLDGAIAAWDRLAKEAPEYEDRALVGKGEVLARQKKFSEARAAYEKVKSDFADGAMARVANERLSRLPPAEPSAGN